MGTIKLEFAKRMSEKLHLKLMMGYMNGWLSFGLSNIPSTFMRVNDNCFGYLSVNLCGILCWYTDLQPNSGATYEPSETNLLQTPGWKVLYKPEEVCFLYKHVIFLEFVISSERVSADPEKVKAITEWPQPQMIREVRSFHGLTTFYLQFIRNFSAIMTPITNCLKNERFQWTPVATKAFKEVKRLMSEAIVMRLQIFWRCLK